MMWDSAAFVVTNTQQYSMYLLLLLCIHTILYCMYRTVDGV